MEAADITKINLLPGNSKLHAVDKLKESFRQFGFRGAVSVNRTTGNILAGNGRITALRQMREAKEPAPENITVDRFGTWLVPCDYRNCTEAEEAALSVAMNKLQDLAGHDDEALMNMLLKFSDNDALLSATGFSNDDVLKLMEKFGTEPAMDGDYAEPGDPSSAPGQGAEPSAEPEHIRVLQLFYTESAQAVFLEAVAATQAARPELASLSDVVFALVTEATNANNTSAEATDGRADSGPGREEAAAN